MKRNLNIWVIDQVLSGVILRSRKMGTAEENTGDVPSVASFSQSLGILHKRNYLQGEP